MKKVLILTPIPIWHPGTKELIELLNDNNFNVELLDVFNGFFIDESGKKRDLYKVENILIRKIFSKILRKYVAAKYIKKESIVDMHYVDSFYKHFIKIFQYKEVKLITTFLGSDLFRQTHNKQTKWQLKILKFSKRIVIGENMINYFNLVFTGMENKVYFNQYGSKRLEIINRMTTINTTTLKQKYGIPIDKKVISVGYNGNPSQQHLKILSKLSSLTKNEKNKIFLIIPVTYSNIKTYTEKILKEAKKTEIKFSLLNKYLTDLEISEIRVVSDILITMQTTDALSNTIKEVLVAKNNVIAADWLPYDIFTKLGCKIHFVNWDNLLTILLKIVFKESDEKVLAKNKKIIYNYCSWQALKDKWINQYKI